MPLFLCIWHMLCTWSEDLTRSLLPSEAGDYGSFWEGLPPVYLNFLIFFLIFCVVFNLTASHWSLSTFSSVGGGGLSHSAFLLAGPHKDGAVSHLQASWLLRGDISCQWATGTMTFGITQAFLLSVLWTAFFPLIKFILSSRKKPNGGTQMVVLITEMVGL